jgi:hypothetical protein
MPGFEEPRNLILERAAPWDMPPWNNPAMDG